MLNSTERIDFISDYIGSYESKIKLLNKNGLFDAAKLFELFAQEVCKLWFGQAFQNLNEIKQNYPYVDLLSNDGNIYVQVSTAQNLPTKIKSTLEKIRDDKRKRFKNLEQVFFFVLNNESVDDIKDFCGTSKIGNIDFIQKKHLITTQSIMNRAVNDLDFQKELYELLYKEINNIKEISNRLFEEIENSKSIGLNNIDCFINDEYEIDKSELVNKIHSCDGQFLSVRGEAGSGKSVLCKKVVENENNILYARAERFTEETNIDDIWNLNLNVALDYLNDEKIIFFIDALEFIADAKQTKIDLLHTLFEIVKNHSNAKIITSCRTSDETAFLKIDSKYGTCSFYLESLTASELLDISAKYPIIKPFLTDKSYSSLVKTPFYVNLIIKNVTDTSNITDENNLRDIIWDNAICLKDNAKDLNVEYSEVVDAVKYIAFKRAKQFSVGIDKAEIKSDIYRALLSEGVIVENSTTIRLKYDIFEDICFEKEFDCIFDSCKGKYNEFFAEIEQYGRCSYRRYQIWVSNKILTKNNREKFLYKLIFAKDILAEWKKQTIIGLIKSNYCESFFEEYSYELINEGLIQTFINITNLYGFEPDLSLSDKAPIIFLTPKGKGREALIKIIHENNLYIDSDLSVISIEKLCSDYSKNQIYNCDIANMSCAILQKHLNEKIENKDFYLHDAEEIFDALLNPIYQMAEFSKDWIISFWEKQKENLTNDVRRNNRISEEVIKYTLKSTTINLAKYLPNELCELAEFFWTVDLKESYPFSMEKDDICYAFGLNKYAEHYGKLDTFKTKYRFFPNLLEQNFYIALDWSINFINKCIVQLSNINDVQLNKETIYFVEKNKKRDYFFFDRMWLAGHQEHILPTVIGDIVYQLRNKIIRIVKSCIQYNLDCTEFVNEVKKRIFLNSNSIMLFTIIEDIGILLKDRFPGYALDLATNINIILCDFERYAYNHPNEIQKSLEQNIYSIFGLPNIPKRYEPEYNINFTLQDYFSQMQFVNEVKTQCINILDYLYTIIPNDAEHASMHLQIQKMDLRNPVIEKIDDNTLAISPNITGAAKKIVDDSTLQSKSKAIIDNSIQKFYKAFDINNYQLNDVLQCINVYYENIKDVDIPFVYDKHKVMLFVHALNKPELDGKLRDKFCNEWIDGVESILNNGSFQFNYPFLLVLYRQINSNASKKTKNRIKRLALNITTYSKNNGLVSKLINITRNYLKENAELSKAIFNTIIVLAKEKKLHVKDFENNNETLNKGHYCAIKKSNLDFNRLRKSVLNKNDTEHIISRYLFDATDFDISNFEISNFDIHTLYHIVNCGIHINDHNVKNIMIQMVKSLLRKLNAKNKSFSYESVVDIEYAISAFFGEELFGNTDIVLDILFNDIDFSCFSDDAIDFYLDIFYILPAYVDSYNNKTKRISCEKIIYSLETKITENVCDGYAKKKLYRALFLSVRGYERNWEKVETKYSFSDTQFLNKMFSKYGRYDVEYFMNTIYKMKLEKLLPHILTSVKTVIEFVVKESSNDKTCLSKVEYIVNQLITISFLNFSDEIKNDAELTEAFENILQILISLSIPHAAVILDEFRIH